MKTHIERLARIFKVLGDQNRLTIVAAIGSDSQSVTDIINATGLSQTLVSFHLRALRKTQIVKTKRRGPFIYYRLTNPELIPFLRTLSLMIRPNDLQAGENKEAVTAEEQAPTRR